MPSHVYNLKTGCLFLFVCCIQQAPVCLGAENIDDVFNLKLEDLLKIEVKVSTQRNQTLTQAPSVISVFELEDIRRMAATSLVDLLSYAPGIETSLQPDGYYKVTIRGESRDGEILFLLDGQTLNSHYDGRAIFDLPTDFIQRVEIIRGPGSALYGTNAVTGVINIVTIKAKEIITSIGNNTLSRFAINQHTDDQRLNYSLGVSQTAGAEKAVSSVSAVGLSPPSTGIAQRSNEDLYAKFQYSGSDFEFGSFGFDRKRSGWTGVGFDLGPETEIKERLLSVNFKYTHTKRKDLEFSSNSYLLWQQKDALNQDHPDGFISNNGIFDQGALTHEKYSITNLGLEFRADKQLSANTQLLSGLVLEQARISDYQLTRNYRVAGLVPQNTFDNFDNYLLQQKNKQRQVSALFVQSSHQLENIDLTLALRYDDYSDFGNALNPRLGLVYLFTPKLTFKALYAHAFRAPTFKELYDETQIGVEGVRGNQSLEAQSNKTAELVMEYQLTDMLIRANLFHNKTEDIIDIFDPFGRGGRADYKNIGQTRSLGGELEIRGVVSSKFNWFINWQQHETTFDWNNAEEFNLQSDFLDSRGVELLLHTPRIRVNIGANIISDSWSAFAALQYGGRTASNKRFALEAFQDDNKPVEIASYWHLNFNIIWPIKEDLKLSLSANNLGSSKYSAPDTSSNIDRFGSNGLIQPDQNIVLSLSYQL
jgi:iron complex outermembrane receptor protein